MFTTGFDMGSAFSVIAVARKGGIDVLANEASYRQTPTLICYAPEQRHIGQSAKTQQKRHVKVTLGNVKRLLGRKFEDPAVAYEQQFQGAQLVRAPDGSVGLETEKYGVVSAIEAAGAFLAQLKRTTESATGQAVRDVVIGVPGTWTDTQRRALLDAARIADLNPLQLINELTAAALELGIRKDVTLEKEDSHVVVFFDMGASQTQASVMRYTKGKMEVLAQDGDSQLGGREFDKLLVDHFRDEFLEKYKIDINTNQRAKLRVWESVNKLKHVLSSVDKAPLNIECLMDDKDVSSSMTREKFQELSKDLVARARKPLERLLETAGLTTDQITTVEVVGDSHRLPAVLEMLEQFFGKPPSKRTNATEAVAKGAAWQCARKSPVFRVRDYDLRDSTCYPVEFASCWSSDNEKPTLPEDAKYRPLFPPNATIGKGSRNVAFNLKPEDTKEGTRTFLTHLRYEAGVPLPAGMSRDIGSWMVSGIKADPQELDKVATLNCNVKIDASGVVSVVKATKDFTTQEEYEAEETVPLSEEELKEQREAEEKKKAEEEKKKAEEEKKKAEEEKKEEEQKEEKAEGDADKKEGDADKKEGDADKKKESDKKEEQKKSEPPKTKRVKVTKTRTKKHSEQLTLTEYDTASLSADLLLAAVNKERELIAADKLVVETNAMKNAVESYCYEFRDKLSYSLEPFALEADRDALKALLQETEDWLYDEGENADKATYAARLDKMKTQGDKIEARYRESQERPEMVAQLSQELAKWRAFVASDDEKYAHIAAEERKKVADKADEVDKWLEAEEKKQADKPLHEDPVFLATHVKDKIKELNAVGTPVMNTPKPKPKPKAEEKKKDEEKKEETDAPKKKEEPVADDVPPLVDDEDDKK